MFKIDMLKFNINEERTGDKVINYVVTLLMVYNLLELIGLFIRY